MTYFDSNCYLKYRQNITNVVRFTASLTVQPSAKKMGQAMKLDPSF